LPERVNHVGETFFREAAREKFTATARALISSTSSLKESQSKLTHKKFVFFTYIALGESPRTACNFGSGLRRRAAIEALRLNLSHPPLSASSSFTGCTLSKRYFDPTFILKDHMDEDMSPSFLGLAEALAVACG